MGLYDFEKKPDRKDTNSVKWSFIGEYTGVNDAIPLWVADMDFETVPEIKEELSRRAEHGIYGYTARTDSYYRELINWLERRQSFRVKQEWITHSSGDCLPLRRSLAGGAAGVSGREQGFCCYIF